MSASKLLPVIEIFGPVIQGEGLLAGHQTHFVRLGGCDYRCSWCDSMYAVDPKQVKKNATMMSVKDIMVKLNRRITSRPGVWITFSGGNPCIHDLTLLMADLNIAKANHNFAINVETQGTICPDWLKLVDLVTVSPKPPSSGNPTGDITLTKFLLKCIGNLDNKNVCLKVVVFNEDDYQYALRIAKTYSDLPFYIQPGTDIQYTDLDLVRKDILDRTAKLTDRLMTDKDVPGHIRVLPQIHSTIYGQTRGV